MTYIEQSIQKLRQYEGSVPWMYLDTVGKVTVGVGLMLPNAVAAKALAFVSGGRGATPDEIAAEFARVSAMPKGRAAAFYRRSGAPELPEAVIEAKLKDVLLGFERHLRAKLPVYDGLPDTAKLALLDMTYNLGPAKLFAQYTNLLQAIGKGDWAEAAQHCSRRGPAPARNSWTRDQFLESVGQVIKAEAEVAISLARWCLLLAGAALTGVAVWLVAGRLLPRNSTRSLRGDQTR